MRKIVLTHGLVAGGILSAMMLLALVFQDAIGFERGALVGYASMVLAFLMIFFGVRSYRERVAGGVVSFGEAFKVGFLIMGVATICYVATWEVIYYRLAPDFGEKYAAFAMEEARKSGASDSALAAQARQMAEFTEMYKNPLVNIAFTTLEPLPVGLLFTLVTAFVQSRRRRTAGAAAAPG